MSLNRPHILVIGDVMLDRYHIGQVNRISPEAPVPIVEIEKTFHRLGAAANVAAGISAMGVFCTLYAVIGIDREGRYLRTLLKKHNIKDACVSSGSTIVKERVISGVQQICRLDFEAKNSFDSSCYNSILPAIYNSQYSCIVFCDYNKGMSLILRDLLDFCQKRNIIVFIDPKQSNWNLYAGGFCIKPNWKEFCIAAQYEGLGSSELEDHAWIEKSARYLSHRYKIPHMVITLGALGYVHISPKNITWHHTRALEVFDLSGAGDTFLATMASCYALGHTIENAIEQGNIASGISVGRSGTSIIGFEDLQINQKNDWIIHRIQNLKKIGKRIVLTNGCFDLLHAGHLYILEESRKYGDILVVCINTDDSIKRLKGKKRPIVPCNERIKMLKALRMVDFVIPFAEDTPIRLIKSIQPNILVKGGDYTINTVIGADFVIKNGGQVIIVPIKQEYSTSNIINTIIN